MPKVLVLDDAIIVGAPTRYGRMPAQMTNFLDQAGPLWARGASHGKLIAQTANRLLAH